MTSTVTHTGFARAFNRLLNLSSKFVWYLSCPRRIDFIVKKVNFCTRIVSHFFYSFVRLHSHCRDISEPSMMPNSKYGSKHCVLCFYLRSITLLGYGLAEVNNEIKLELCTSRTMRSPKFKYSFRIHLCWCVFFCLSLILFPLCLLLSGQNILDYWLDATHLLLGTILWLCLWTLWSIKLSQRPIVGNAHSNWWAYI